MHFLRYIYDFIIHFSNGVGIFTVVTDADDKLNSVSELVNAFMLWLILWRRYIAQLQHFFVDFSLFIFTL